MAMVFRREVVGRQRRHRQHEDDRAQRCREAGQRLPAAGSSGPSSIFAAVAFLSPLLLPAHSAERHAESGSADLPVPFLPLSARCSRSAIGYLGMWLATQGEPAGGAAASREEGGREIAMRVAFRTGGVVGMFTVGLGLFGAAVVVLDYAGRAPEGAGGLRVRRRAVAMFMRVGGGIFTKAADVGADLVGKVEQSIPEDDPRNAATIADNVGDNVGDCAGMAADLFESYAVTLVAALILGSAAFGKDGLVFPLIVPAIGVDHRGARRVHPQGQGERERSGRHQPRHSTSPR